MPNTSMKCDGSACRVVAIIEVQFMQHEKRAVAVSELLLDT